MNSLETVINTRISTCMDSIEIQRSRIVLYDTLQLIQGAWCKGDFSSFLQPTPHPMRNRDPVWYAVIISNFLGVDDRVIMRHKWLDVEYRRSIDKVQPADVDSEWLTGVLPPADGIYLAQSQTNRIWPMRRAGGKQTNLLSPKSWRGNLCWELS